MREKLKLCFAAMRRMIPLGRVPLSGSFNYSLMCKGNTKAILIIDLNKPLQWEKLRMPAMRFNFFFRQWAYCKGLKNGAVWKKALKGYNNRESYCRKILIFIIKIKSPLLIKDTAGLTNKDTGKVTYKSQCTKDTACHL